MPVRPALPRLQAGASDHNGRLKSRKVLWIVRSLFAATEASTGGRSQGGRDPRGLSSAPS